ncbi:endoplasmin homolog [Olea europaea subsp. europaea]|uniref:Endoplasmin homolog n=1 Tax=Olea europaea subsp. europaea TaxID=158383 RepID=A0A8S0RE26_OLEEU|nr:endoplasmin homolog [Olea europaea subsp. europaea]
MKLNPMRKGRKKMLRKKRMRKNPRQKQLEKTTYEWEFLNDVKAIWLRNPKDLIEEEYEKFYCSLVKGLVDSDTVSHSVSREMLQHSSLKTLKKKLIRKALDMIRKLDEEDPDKSNYKDKKDCVNWEPNYRLLLVPDLVMKLNDAADNEESSDSNEKREQSQMQRSTGEKSPFLERLTKKNYEVILFTDPVDEYLMQYLMDYEDKKFQNVSKD